jgi:hypothetical protein
LFEDRTLKILVPPYKLREEGKNRSIIVFISYAFIYKNKIVAPSELSWEQEND